MIDSVFVIRSADNSLVFYGQLSEAQPEDLETVLGQILMKAKGQSPGTQKLVGLKQGKFLFGIYPTFCVIIGLSKGTEKDIADKLLKQLGDKFKSQYEEKLASYSGDNSIFSAFSDNIKEILSSFSATSSAPATEAEPESSKAEELSGDTVIASHGDAKAEIDQVFGKSDEASAAPAEGEESTEKTMKPGPSSELSLSLRKGMIEIKKSTAAVDTFAGDKPLVTPQKRQAYPDGIPDYARDEVLFNESFEVQKNFECELINYSVSNIKITLNISLTHIYELEIDFTEYPERPKIILNDSVKHELGKPIEEISYFLRNWDPKIPAHITEIVYELEKIFTRFKSEGKLQATQEMPGYVLPELEPLKDDIKWDPNFKPKSLAPPPPIDPATIEAQARPVSNAPQPPKMSAPAPGKASGALFAPSGAKGAQAPQGTPQPVVDEKTRKLQEQKAKEDEKSRKIKEKEEAKQRMDLEKLKKKQEKEDKAMKRRQQAFADDDEEGKKVADDE